MKFFNLYRVYIDQPLYENKIFTIENEQAHYLKNVLRLKVGDHLQVFNSHDGEYLCQLQKIGKNDLIVNLPRLSRQPDVELSTILAVSIIKQDNMTEAVNMAVQLGVTEIIPIVSERSQGRSINSKRLTKIIIEATEQSKRINVPKLHSVTYLSKILEEFSFAKIIYANEREDSKNLITKIQVHSEPVLLIIGPEGGFSDIELQILQNHSNCHSVSLGKYILRTETAVAAGLAQIKVARCQK
ncbi:MAG: 16S rRNA (uracil(1498)-N(3))-methyltransferase [Rickettsiaceae bacterium]|nr:MAG: 16S rRNA (uracil(1498)-N(3))-methyltransferase [Rickettsiaceae bacterium]